MTLAGMASTTPPADGQLVGPPVLKHFEFGHLPADLARVSEQFHDLAHDLADRFQGDELETALNRLVEAKDWAVRAALAAR